LVYYYQKTGSKKYSAKLSTQIESAIARLSIFPNLGIPTSYITIRALTEGNYKIIYKANHEDIQILMVWDMRQNPKNLQIDKLL